MWSAALTLSLSMMCQQPAAGDPADVARLQAALRAQSPLLAALVDAPREHRFHLLLSEVEIDAAGVPRLRRIELGDPEQYFYPASSIKTAGAVAAVLELQRISAATGSPFDLSTRMRIGRLFDGDAVQGRDPGAASGDWIRVRREIRKLFLVSDNVAFNRCYELAGHRGINELMHTAGFASCRVLHRLSEFRSVADQRRTRPVELSMDGDRWHRIAARTSDLVMRNEDLADTEIGDAHFAGGQRVDGPLSFLEKNAISVRDLQDMLIAIVRPEIDTGKRGFPQLSLQARRVLCAAMSELPRESKDPSYNPERYPDHYAKFMLPGFARVLPASRLRIYNKIGRAYGFSTDNAYIEDVATGRGVFVTAVLYTNPNATLNDDKYAYEERADPAFADLGEVVARRVFSAAGPPPADLSPRGRK